MSKGARDRANAKRIVEQQKAAERRRKVTLWTSVSVVALLVIAGLIGWGVVANQDKNEAGKLVTPSVAVDNGTAFAVGSGPVQVDIWEDFMCPACHQFETGAEATIQQLVDEKKVTVYYHPVSILDRFSNGTQYSTRAAGASAAAAQEGKFAEFHKVLFANQPEENSDGLSNEKLIELGKSIGLGDTFASAVNSRTYDSWVGKVTDAFSAKNYTGTPTVVVAGKQLTGPNDTLPTAEILSQAVAAAAG